MWGIKTMTKQWIVRMCKLEDLENTLNEVEDAGYVIDKYEPIQESFFWMVSAHIVSVGE